MKTLLLSINSKYIHTLLAPRYLKANCVDLDVEIYETNVNVNIDNVLRDVYFKHPDVVAISCYIFNIEFVRKLLGELKQILPDVKIILGGYEATFDVDRYIDSVDYIMKGEGDFVFNELLHDIIDKTNKYDKIVECGTVCDLNKIKSPYDEEYCSLGKDKILYFESSRGCPFSCSYCMSANTRGVRTFALDRTFNDLKNIMSYNPKQIKFVDRTFNFDINRANKIIKFIIDNFSNTNTNFHFEMEPELFNDETFELIKNAKKGLFQYELGVQSYNLETLNEVGRKANVDVIENNLKRLVNLHNANVHVDLIAGLPLENLASFIDGFNRLFCLKTSCLQLGFLKVLKGSKIYYNDKGYIVKNMPPYEIISTPWLSFDEVLELKQVEEMLEIFYNSGRFNKSMDFLLPSFYSPYSFFLELSKKYKNIYSQGENVSTFHLCDLLFDFCKETKLSNNDDAIKELELIINEDFSLSGNTRKWRRNLS